ncbi:MAG TPA: hypothetical protein PKH96_22685, partial [Gemmatimonadaceae bacterium]|nr:hypothetical protein [Gemmatimonadaceae bacterium]
TPDLLNAIQALSQLSYAPARDATLTTSGNRRFQEPGSVSGSSIDVKKSTLADSPSNGILQRLFPLLR